MAHDYIKQDRQYVTARGRRIPISEVRAGVDELVGLVSDKAARLAERYANGEIGIIEFELLMRDLLRSGHLVSAAIGKGGWRRMNQADFGRVGARLKKEYGYLAKFVRKLERGTLNKAFSGYRARMYARGIVMAYHETMRRERVQPQAEEGRDRVRLVTHSKEGCPECAADEARGWVDPADMAELGTRECKNFCLCDLVFESDVNAGRITLQGEPTGN